jgi:hypothetical protein
VGLPSLSLAVVGADYPNMRGPGRRFEIELCRPGEPVELRREPKNPKDPRAVAVFSARGVQIGYLTAERAPWIGKLIGEGRDVAAVFQAKASYGAMIRIAFDGEQPSLPPPSSPAPEQDDGGFYPDFIPPDV